MSVLESPLTITGSKGRRVCTAMFDSGASYSIVGRDIAQDIAQLEALPDPSEWVFETAKPGEFIQAIGVVRLEFRFADSDARFSDEFVVFDELSQEIIIGAKTMQAWKITLDFAAEEIRYRKSAERLRVI